MSFGETETSMSLPSSEESGALFFKGRPVPGNAQQGDEPSCGGGRAGEPDCSLRWRPARQDAALVASAHRAGDQASYRNAAEANKPTASQVAAHSPNNRNNTAVIDTLSDQ